MPNTPSPSRSDREIIGKIQRALHGARDEMDALYEIAKTANKNAAIGHSHRASTKIGASLVWLADLEKVAVASENSPHISAGGAYELKLYGTPGYVGTVAGITVYADPDVPEHTVVVKDELGRELGRIINVGK